jgi:hypothetical protein
MAAFHGTRWDVGYRHPVVNVIGCHRIQIIFLNVHATTEDKIKDMKDSFYKELERVFDKFPKYRWKFC